MPTNDELLYGPPVEHWRLLVEFDPLTVQVETDPEDEFPRDAVTRFIGFLCQRWGCGPDELQEFVGWSDDRVAIHADVLDQLSEVHEYLIMRTSPRRIELTRAD